MKTTAQVLIVVAIATLSSRTRGEQRDSAVAPIASLAFLEGTWKGTFEGERFETSYSSPAGGRIVSWSKGFTGEKANFFELEVFEEREGKVVVTPYPDGDRSCAFTLIEMDGERATFESSKLDFPRRLVYERVARDKLRFVVSGNRAGEPIEWRVEVVRASARD